jgi:hypothetical protein
MNNPNFPQGWSMTDDLAKKVGEELRRKSLTPEVMLQDALGEFARDMAIIESNPVDWGGWYIYLIEQMVGQAASRIY